MWGRVKTQRGRVVGLGRSQSLRKRRRRPVDRAEEADNRYASQTRNRRREPWLTAPRNRPTRNSDDERLVLLERSRTWRPLWPCRKTSSWMLSTASRGRRFSPGNARGCRAGRWRAERCTLCSSSSSSCTSVSCARGGRRRPRARSFSGIRPKARSTRGYCGGSAPNSRRANSFPAPRPRTKWCAWCSRSRRRSSQCRRHYPARSRTCRRPTSERLWRIT